MKGLGAADSGAAAGLQFCVFGRGQRVKLSLQGHESINSALALTEMWLSDRIQWITSVSPVRLRIRYGCSMMMKLLPVNTLQCCCCGNTGHSWFTWTQSFWMTHLSNVEWPHVRWTPSRPADFCKTHSPHQRVHDPVTFNILKDLDLKMGPKTRGASKLKEHYFLYFSTPLLLLHHLWPLLSPATDGSSQKCIIHHSHGESISLLWTNWRLLRRNLRIIEHRGSSRLNEIFTQMINIVFFQHQQKKIPKDTDTVGSPASGTCSTTWYTYNKKLKYSQVHRREHINILFPFKLSNRQRRW